MKKKKKKIKIKNKKKWVKIKRREEKSPDWMDCKRNLKIIISNMSETNTNHEKGKPTHVLSRNKTLNKEKLGKKIIMNKMSKFI
jgi:hypothetical protein